MIADLSSSLGLFAFVWLAICVLASVVVTDALLRSNAAVPASPSDEGTCDEAGQHACD